MEADGKSVGIKLGCDEIEGCKVGSIDGEVDIDGARLACNVGTDETVG